MIGRNAEAEIFDDMKQGEANLDRSKTHSYAYTGSATEWQIDGTVAHFEIIESFWKEFIRFWEMLWIAVKWNEKTKMSLAGNSIEIQIQRIHETHECNAWTGIITAVPGGIVIGALFPMLGKV